MEQQERRAVEAVLRRSADKVDQTLFAGEGADGNLPRAGLRLLGQY